MGWPRQHQSNKQRTVTRAGLRKSRLGANRKKKKKMKADVWLIHKTCHKFPNHTLGSAGEYEERESLKCQQGAPGHLSLSQFLVPCHRMVQIPCFCVLPSHSQFSSSVGLSSSTETALAYTNNESNPVIYSQSSLQSTVSGPLFCVCSLQI